MNEIEIEMDKDKILTVFECCQRYNAYKEVERVVGCELEASKKIGERRYKLVDTIFYDNSRILELWAGFADRGFKLYTLAEGYWSDEYILQYKNETIMTFSCPPTLNELITQIYKVDIKFVFFIVQGKLVNAVIKSRVARDAWGAARDARGAARDAWGAAWDARDARDAAWDAWDAAWGAARKAWDAAWDAARDASKRAFKVGMKSIWKILKLNDKKGVM